MKKFSLRHEISSSGAHSPGVSPRKLTHEFSKDGRVYREGRGLCQRQTCPSDKKNLSMFLKLCFLSFRYFFITCKHINIWDEVNNIMFITAQSLTRTLREHDYFAFNASLAIFEFMKVKVWEFK